MATDRQTDKPVCDVVRSAADNRHLESNKMLIKFTQKSSAMSSP